MGLFAKIIDLLFPPTCAVCDSGVSDSGNICDDCRQKFIRECFEHCKICEKPASSCICNTHFTDVTKYTVGGRNSISLTFYLSEREYGKETGRVTEKMIYALKERGIFADLFADELARAIRNAFASSGEKIEDWIITYPPRSTKNFYKYGIDQCEELSNRLGRCLGCKTKKTFIRGGRSAEQKTLSPDGRRENAESSLIPIRRNISDGGKYFIVDDIITTGATVETAAKMLYSCGAAAVFPISIARDMPSGK